MHILLNTWCNIELTIYWKLFTFFTLKLMLTSNMRNLLKNNLLLVKLYLLKRLLLEKPLRIRKKSSLTNPMLLLLKYLWIIHNLNLMFTPSWWFPPNLPQLWTLVTQTHPYKQIHPMFMFHRFHWMCKAFKHDQPVFGCKKSSFQCLVRRPTCHV